MNWFQRHLNWSVVLAAIVLNILFYVFFDVVMYLEGTSFLIAFILDALIMSIVVVWMLRQKNRRLWWLLLWWFVPLGSVFVLRLSNKRYS